jgi:hypothetical protein
MRVASKPASNAGEAMVSWLCFFMGIMPVLGSSLSHRVTIWATSASLLSSLKVAFKCRNSIYQAFTDRLLLKSLNSLDPNLDTGTQGLTNTAEVSIGFFVVD